MDARSLRDKFAKREIQLRTEQFMAPFTDGVQKALVKVDGVVHPFRIVGQRGSGFGIFKPRDGTCAYFVRAAEFEQTRAYLDILPKIHLILAYETDKGWVAYPMNAEAADKTLGLESEVVVKCVTDCERFDTIVVRYDTINFWFDEIFLGGDPAKADSMRECFRKDWTPQQMKKALAQVKGLTPEDRKTFDLAVKSWQKFQVLSTEDRIKKVLQESAARLGSYVVRGDQLEVRWKTDRGTAYTSMVHKDTLDVVSAGICLDPHDGRGPQDNQFNLRDLPYVMRQGEDRQEIVRRGTAWEQGYQDDDED